MVMAKLYPGSEIDGFTIHEQMHKGGMAVLWRATKPGIDWNGARWTFHDGPGRVRTVAGGAGGQPVRAAYRWMRPGLHRVDWNFRDAKAAIGQYRVILNVDGQEHARTLSLEAE